MSRILSFSHGGWLESKAGVIDPYRLERNSPRYVFFAFWCAGKLFLAWFRLCSSEGEEEDRNGNN